MFREGSTVGPYTLVRKLGSGSFGAVWLADRVTPIATTTVALKVPLGDEVNMDAIKQEATTWVQASGHPNVVPIIEANMYDGQVIIASEYIDSGSLEDWLRRNGGRAPSIDGAVDIVCGILSGLEHLHSRHIIHRDIKPANLLLQGETPRLVDFGISRILKNTSRSIMAAGTPSYMAPEAFDGRRNEQTDIWSVGVIMYQMLAGRLPYPQQEMTSLIGAIVSGSPDPLPVSVPGPVQAVLNRAMAKDPAQRFRSASEMRAALRNAMEVVRQGRGQQAPAPSPQPVRGGTIVETPQQRQQGFMSGGGAAPAPTMPNRQQPTAQGGVTPTMKVSPQQYGQQYPQQYPQQYQQQYAQPQFGMPSRAKNNKPMIIIAIVIGVLLVGGGITAAVLLGGGSSSTTTTTTSTLAGGGGGGGGGTAPAESVDVVANKVITAWRANDEQAMRNLSARANQQTVVEQMNAFNIGAYMQFQGVSSMSLMSSNVAGNTATADYMVTFNEGTRGTDKMRLMIEDRAWKVVSLFEPTQQ